MKKSKDEKVQSFLEDIMTLDLEKFEMLLAMREIVFEIHPKVSERMMYGGIMFSLAEDFGGLFVSKKHISFEFSNGFQFKDSKKLLEGGGKFRRHLKIRSSEDIQTKEVDYFVKQVK